MSEVLAKAIEAEIDPASRERSEELTPDSSSAEKRAEVEAAVILARRFPRNEDEAWRRIHLSIKRISFAEDCTYSFPRGGQTVSGPSVYLARQLARAWGNIRYGFEFVRDDARDIVIRGWAWDLETNARVSAEDSFRKLVQRKVEEGGKKVTRWITPDERDLRELVNRRAAMLIRNCILQLIPSDIVEAAVEESFSVVESKAAADPDSQRKKIVAAFADLGVTVQSIESFLDHPLSESTPKEIADLRAAYSAVRDGSISWRELIGEKVETPTVESAPSVSKVEALANRIAQGGTSVPTGAVSPTAHLPLESAKTLQQSGPVVAGGETKKKTLSPADKMRLASLRAAARSTIEEIEGPAVTEHMIAAFIESTAGTEFDQFDPLALDKKESEALAEMLREKDRAEKFLVEFQEDEARRKSA